MVSFSQSCHYFSFNKLPTPVAAGTIHALVIQGAKVFPVLNEKASLCQVTATHWKKKKHNTYWKIHLQKMSETVCAANKWDYPGGLTSLYWILAYTYCHYMALTRQATRDLVIKNLFGETYTIITLMHSGLTKTSVILYYPVNHASSCMKKLNLRFDFMLLNIRYDIVPDSSSQLSGFMFSSQ